MQTPETRCPHCNGRLPRQSQFVPPSYGRPTVFGVTTFIAGYWAVLYILIHLGWPWRTMLFWTIPRYPEGVGKLVLAGSLFGIWLTMLGVAVTTFFWFEERTTRREEPEEEETPGYDTETRIGGDIRAVPSLEGRRRWLREVGYTVPAEPERGALVHWLFGVHDGKVTFSQRGARTTIRNNPAVRQWANDILALFCLAGWATPVNGWEGDEPDLGNGVENVDDEVIYAIARDGYEGLIDRLTMLVDASVEPPHSDDESEEPT